MRVPSKSPRRRVRRCFVALSILLLVACEDRHEATRRVEDNRPVFRVGLIPEQNIFEQKKRYEPLADYLSQRIGVAIELMVLPRYGDVIDAFAVRQLDGAFFGSFVGAVAHARLGVEAVARPLLRDGTSTYHGLIFVRKDSGITGGAGMKGKRFAFVDRATTAGWLLPLHYFKAEGIRDHRTYFAESYFAGTHDAAIYDVLEGKADVGAAKNTVFESLARSDPRITAELSVLARSPEVPGNGLCVREGIDGRLKARLAEALLGMDGEEAGRKVLQEFGALRFIAASERDFTVVFEYAASVGLDLKTYDYLAD